MRGRLAYEITSGVNAGVNISYDEAFETRVSADLKVRFGGASTTDLRKEIQQLPVINALITTPGNRDLRVHDQWNLAPCNIAGGGYPGENVGDVWGARGQSCDLGAVRK